MNREIIIKHYKNPINRDKEYLPSAIIGNSKIDSCIDDITLYVDIKDNTIKDISFNGEACAICISSTSIMIENVTGKSLEDVLEYIKNFEDMIDGNAYDESILGEATAYCDLVNQNSRKNCALLSYKILKKII
ncbi:MAG: SUF system NifU family Fe-S cluster assembly protein [bacterium]